MMLTALKSLPSEISLILRALELLKHAQSYVDKSL